MTRGTDALYGRQGGRLEPWERRQRAPHTRERHPLEGLRCSCPPGCTDLVWGDQDRCAHDCAPCTLMAGRRYDRADLPGAGRFDL